MTLQDLTSKELNDLKELAGSKTFLKILEKRIEGLEEDLIKGEVYDVPGMIARARQGGIYHAFKTLHGLKASIEEEYELREEEKELTLKK